MNGSLFLVPETLPFGVAIVIMLGLAVIEGIGLFTAISLSEWLEGVVPSIDSPDGLEGALGWLHVGKVPILVLLIIFLLGFALCGYVVQIAARSIIGNYLHSLLAAVPAVFVGISSVRSIGGLLVHVIPRDETTAVSGIELIGRSGVVTQGTARSGYPAEVKVRDAHGNHHYLRLEPDVETDVFEEGTPVLVVRRIGATYRGIHNPHPEILN